MSTKPVSRNAVQSIHHNVDSDSEIIDAVNLRPGFNIILLQFAPIVTDVQTRL
jgi:hypothetical protein